MGVRRSILAVLTAWLRGRGGTRERGLPCRLQRLAHGAFEVPAGRAFREPPRAPGGSERDDATKNCELYWTIIRGPGGKILERWWMRPGVHMQWLWYLALQYWEILLLELLLEFGKAGVRGKRKLRKHVERCGMRLWSSDDGREFSLTIDREPKDVLEGAEGPGRLTVRYTGVVVAESDPQFATLWH